jgi:hypothetical protein
LNIDHVWPIVVMKTHIGLFGFELHFDYLRDVDRGMGSSGTYGQVEFAGNNTCTGGKI